MSALIEGVFRRLLARPAANPVPAYEEQDKEEARSDPRDPARGSALLEWIDQEDCDRAQPVHLLNQSRGGFAVRSAAPLDAGWPVLLTLPEGPPLKAVVRHRRRDPEGWVLGLQLIQRERRRFDRRPLDRKIELVWQGQDGRRCVARGRIRDVGEGGLSFVCADEIPLRTSVLMAIEGWQRFGTLAHVRPERDLHNYGVQFSGPPILMQGADFDE